MLDWRLLTYEEREAFETTVTFVTGRLREVATIEWALGLRPHDRGERAGTLCVVEKARLEGLGEPWTSTWALIEESWLAVDARDPDGVGAALVAMRLTAGDRSGALVEAIDALVAPRLRVEPKDPRESRGRARRHRDLIRATLTSGRLVNPHDLGLSEVKDIGFLTAVANALEASMRYGMDAGRRIGWDGGEQLWPLGQLYRVEYNEQSDDADEFHKGIAPVAKLLYEVVRHLAELDTEAASAFVRGWGLQRSTLDVRLWAAAAKNPILASAREVGAFLLGLDDRRFWDLHVHPEIADLRARRYSQLDPQTQTAIALRLRRKPPRSHWPRGAEADRVEEAREFWAARELRRIEVSMGSLPEPATAWLSSRIARFGKLAGLQLDEGFLEAPRAEWVGEAAPDRRYDSLRGKARLRALEVAWAANTDHWRRDPARSWLREEGNARETLNDLNSLEGRSDEFPAVWNHFGMAHAPTDDARRNRREVALVLTLLKGLSVATIRRAIQGLSEWLSTWAEDVVVVAGWEETWLRIWPEAVSVTNAYYQDDDEGNLSVVVSSGNPDSPMDLDVVNTEAGHLVKVFLQACPTITPDEPNPFEKQAGLRKIRHALVASQGQALLIARHGLTAALHYFVRADEAWAKANLIDPLVADNPNTLALWRAVSSRVLRQDVLKLIGHDVADRVTDRELDRDTKTRLLRSLVGESLGAFLEQREPAVANARLHQVLRLLDDELRSSAAHDVVDFIEQVGGVQGRTAADVFSMAGMPFLDQVWPRDRSLVTPGVAKAFAELPVASGDAFALAVHAVRSRLVPFDCYGLMDFGFGTARADGARLKLIKDEAKARALLELLDATVGTDEDAVMPYDLSDALSQIESVERRLVDARPFRRLAAAARR